jgi:Phosphoesterase family/Putative Ig domain/Cellulase (glycosyl hydrolase family 5)
MSVLLRATVLLLFFLLQYGGAVAQLKITTNSILPVGTTNLPYLAQLNATGGVPPYTWTFAGGQLPSGLTLAGSGIVSGIPSNSGTYVFLATVTDSASHTATGTFTISVNIGSTGGGGGGGGSTSPLAIGTVGLPTGTTFSSYSFQLVATGGLLPYTWTLTSGSLPAGISLSAGGLLSGVPTTAGSSTFTVRVTDGAASTQAATYTLIINAATLTITSLTVPSGTVGSAYSFQLTAQGGATPYTWAVSSGSLPTSLSLSSGGLISGTPTVAGTSTFTIQVTDNVAATATQSYSLTIVSNTPSAGCTYYVSPSGNDSNAGTSTGSPWLTPQHAFDTVLAGQVVCFRGGSYGSTSGSGIKQTENTSGNSSSPITFTNYPSETAVIKGSTRINGSYVIFKGTPITTGYCSHANPCGLVFEGTADNVTDNVDVCCNGGPHNDTFDHVEFRNGTFHAGLYLEGGNHTVKGCYIHDNGNGTSDATHNTDNGLYVSTGTSGSLIANNLVEHNWSKGIQLYSGGSCSEPTNVTVEENTSVNQGSYGLVTWGTGNRIVNNIAYGNGGADSSNQGRATGSGHIIDSNFTVQGGGHGSGWLNTADCPTASETNNNTSDPAFVNAGSLDWHLTNTSPAVGFSNTTYVQTTDHDGIARGPRYDAGAYQLPSAVTPPPTTPPPPPPSSGALPQFSHIILVIEENHGYSQVLPSGMSYLNSLGTGPIGGIATNYIAATHPSIDNYFMLTAGAYFAGGNDSWNCTTTTGVISADNLVRELINAGKSWKVYAESIPSPGYTGCDSGAYAKKHNPFAYFNDVANASIQKNKIVNFTSNFAADLAGNTLPQFSLVIPNLNNDAHDGSLATADSWLSTNIGPLLSNPQFTSSGLLIVVFDEDSCTGCAGCSGTNENCGGHVTTVVVSPKIIAAGFASNTQHVHSDTLALICGGLGLASCPGLAAASRNFSEFFATSSAGVPNTFFGATVDSFSSFPLSGGITLYTLGKKPGTTWAYIEPTTDCGPDPTSGCYNWSGLQNWVNYAQSHGMQLVYDIDSMPGWLCADHNVDGRCRALPTSLTAVSNFATALATKFKGQIKYYETYNEVDGNYEWNDTCTNLVLFHNTIYNAIKAADHTATVGAPNMAVQSLITSACATGTGNPSDSALWLKNFLGTSDINGHKPSYDAVGVHSYGPFTYPGCSNSTTPPCYVPTKYGCDFRTDHMHCAAAPLLNLYNGFRAVVPTKPLLVTEGGFGPDVVGSSFCTNVTVQNTACLTNTQQAAYIGRWLVLSASTWSDRSGQLPSWYAYDINWGTLNGSNGMNPQNATAFGQMENWLQGATFSAPCRTGTPSSLFVCDFTNGSRHRAEIVFNDGNGSTVSYSAPSWATTFQPLLGSLSSISGGTITVGDMPILLQ